ncbi:MAG: hypothetical protein ISS36_04395 [Candidatus Aenigmarchaeota archaeon]|nr:hypothetical protein [Candidatus Aenigmarchaeota archaeon]
MKIVVEDPMDLELLGEEERLQLAEKAASDCSKFYGEKLKRFSISDSNTESSTFTPNLESGKLVPAIQITRPGLLTYGLDKLGKKKRAKKIRYRYRRLITHELAHIYHILFFNFCCPKWLDEGMAEYVAYESRKSDGVMKTKKKRSIIWKRGEGLKTGRKFRIDRFHYYSQWIRSADERHYAIAYENIYHMLNTKHASTKERKKSAFKLMSDFAAEKSLIEFAEEYLEEHGLPDNMDEIMIAYEREHLAEKTPKEFEKTYSEILL